MTISDYNYCVKTHADGLYRFACKSLRDEDDAKDAVQQAFMVLWERKNDVFPEKAKSFLFTVVHRKSMDVHRKRKKLVEIDDLNENSQIQYQQEYDLNQILQKALNLLSEQARSLVLLKDYEGYSYEEIAELTDLNVTQVKVYLHRARKVLKNYLVAKEYLI